MEKPMDAEMSQAASISTSPRYQLRVLVVDDNEDAADSLQMLLQRDGHDVHTAYDGRTALRLVDQMRPDVVFLDIGMPNMNGYEVARTLSRFPGRGSMRIIAMTGWGQLSDKQRALEAGFDLHLMKPIGAEDLSRVLSGADDE
jgi:CheY-like chemotaxis protein